MERKHLFLIIGAIIVTQLLSTAIISKQFARQDTETIYIPIHQQPSTSQDSSEPPLITSAIRLPTEEALRKVIRSALKKELKVFIDESDEIRISDSATSQSGGTTQTQAAGVEFIEPQVREEAWNQSTQIIDQAIENGTWTNQNNNEIAESVTKLTRQQHIQLIEKLGEALERGEILLENGADPVL